MSQSAFILVLDHDEARGQKMRDLLRERHSHACRVVATDEEAFESIRQRAPDIVVAYLDGNPSSADSLSRLLDETAPDATLLIVGDGGPPAGRRIEIVALPADAEVETIASRISQRAAKAVARREDRRLKESIQTHAQMDFEGIVGESPAIRRIVERIKKIARGKHTVLILGETGTGKELIARAIHNQSPRRNKPFHAVNCAAFNENLLESELFGHVKGAYTGAHSERKGLFAVADGGTLFLDEIGDMSPTMQAKLLRVLDQREFSPVGSNEIKRVDVRVIAATDADLLKKVEQKQFRDALYYRVHQAEIPVPALRERRQDIPLLAHRLLEIANRENGASVPGISSEAMVVLTRYYWPGNVRELKSLMEALTVEVNDRQIELEDLPERIRGSREMVPASSIPLVGITFAQMERLMIERALQATNGNREEAAKMLGIGTRTLYRKIKEYEL